MLKILNSLQDLSPGGFAVRAVLVGLMLYFLSRKLPRRSAGQFAGYDFVFFWMMGGLTASPLYDPKINFADTITAISTVYFWHHAIAYLAVKSRLLARIIYGRPVVLIEGGKIVHQNMRSALFNTELLLSELRTMDAGNLNEVECAVLETNGHVSVIKKSHAQNVTPRDLQILTPAIAPPTVVIDDGKVMEENLANMNHDEKWLKDQLNKYGVFRPADVYFASVDGSGQLYYSVKKPSS
ncbi:MAG: DUF421 domain-containing protein [Clostridia bacterium]|nr:DUF421 domain-containing protein [Clostridia bacterium]